MMDTAELPDAWKPPPAPEVPDVISAPTWNADDPAQLSCWFGNFGMWDHWRKVVQASCEEVIRAKYALSKEAKPSEQRLGVMARLHPAYLEFLTDGLVGRTLYERNVASVRGQP